MTVLLHDANDLLSKPVPPIDWFLDRLIPAGVTMDDFAPPGTGKTSLLTDLAVTVAAETGQWHGRACAGGPVVLLGGERTNPGVLSRDLHRTGRSAPLPGALVVPHDRNGDCPPVWRWDRKSGSWDLTPWGREITDWLLGARPALVILDTILSCASGSNLLDPPQQYDLGMMVIKWTRLIGAGLTVSVSHTNQASSSAALHDRLDYLSRAGGNGYPGAIRHIAGMTKLRRGEVPGFDPTQDGAMFAVGFSKHNETPPTDWTHYKPAIFTQCQAGKLALLADGQEVAERLAQAAAAAEDDGGKRRKTTNDHRAAGDLVAARPSRHARQARGDAHEYAEEVPF